MIALENITFGYPDCGPIFREFSWQIDAGEQWSVVGPSGCGKSTLLMLLTGLIRPQAGRICVDGDELSMPLPENGLVFQDYELLPWGTLRQNVEIGLKIRAFQKERQEDGGRLDRRSIRDRADQWLRRLDLSEVAERFPAHVSGGQRQRAAIARALTMNARRLFMDEPFSALDEPTREALRQTTQALCREQNLSLVLVTHSIEEAVLLGQKILVLGPGNPVEPRILPNSHGDSIDLRQDPSWGERCARARGGLV